MRYVSFIHRDEAGYGVSFPDFPGCVSVGDTVDDAIRHGSEALAFHVEGPRRGRRGDSGATHDRRHQGRPGTGGLAAGGRPRADPAPSRPRIVPTGQHLPGPRPSGSHRRRGQTAPDDPLGVPGDGGPARDRGHLGQGWHERPGTNEGACAGRCTHAPQGQRSPRLKVIASNGRWSVPLMLSATRCAGAGFQPATSADERRYEHRPRARMPTIPGRLRPWQSHRTGMNSVRNQVRPWAVTARWRASRGGAEPRGRGAAGPRISASAPRARTGRSSGRGSAARPSRSGRRRRGPPRSSHHGAGPAPAPRGPRRG